MKDFEIKDNLIFTKRSIVAIFQIEPIDVFLLDFEEVEIFYLKLKDFLNLLNGEIQLITQIKRTKIEDFQKHFISMRNSAKENRKLEEFVNSNIEDMKELIEDHNNISLTKKFYLQISENVNTQNLNLLPKAIRNLEIKMQRIYPSITDAKIEIKQLKNKEIKNYINEFFK